MDQIKRLAKIWDQDLKDRLDRDCKWPLINAVEEYIKLSKQGFLDDEIEDLWERRNYYSQ